MGSKYRGGFSLLVPLWDDGIQFSTWRRANALAHDDGMFTLWTAPDGNVCMHVCMYADDGTPRVHFCVHLCGIHLMGMYVCMYVWLVAADVWEVNTEAGFHCWCRVG